MALILNGVLMVRLSTEISINLWWNVDYVQYNFDQLLMRCQHSKMAHPIL